MATNPLKKVLQLAAGKPASVPADPLQTALAEAHQVCDAAAAEATAAAAAAQREIDAATARLQPLRDQLGRLQQRAEQQRADDARAVAELEAQRAQAGETFAAAVAAGDSDAEGAAAQAISRIEDRLRLRSAGTTDQALAAAVTAKQAEVAEVEEALAQHRAALAHAELERLGTEHDRALNGYMASLVQLRAALDKHRSAGIASMAAAHAVDRVSAQFVSGERAVLFRHGTQSDKPDHMGRFHVDSNSVLNSARRLAELAD